MLSRAQTFTVWTLAIVFLPLAAKAQTPLGTAFTYQGQLKQAGLPMNGAANMTFQLYDALSGGALIGAQTINGVPITNGLFSVVLNDSFALGGSAFNGNKRWLAITVNGTLLAPRQEITAVPYSLGLRLPYSATGSNTVSGVLNITSTNGGAITGTAGNVGGNAAGVSGYSPATSGIGVFGRATGTTGTNYGGWFQSFSPTGYALQANNTAGGISGRFVDSLSTSSAECVEITSDGNSTSKAISAEHTGTGDCGYFVVNNADSGAEALEGRTNGRGDAVQAINTGTGRAGYFQVANSASTATALHATTNGSGSAATAVQTGTGRAGTFQVSNTSNTNTALYATTNGGGRIAQFDTLSATSTGVQILIANGSNPNSALSVQTLNASVPALRVSGTARVDVLEIVGADVAERFPATEELKPGQVVMIDAEHPGQLCLARGAYNRRVAGIASGANGLPAGTVLGHLPGHEQAPPIALSGRVWAHCDASQEAIGPGDLITTADKPGHGMKVLDFARAQGAIIGKAMTSLPCGKSGLVLILVSLQ